VTAQTFRQILEEQIAKSTRLMTDGAPIYGKISGAFARQETVNHLIKEYARGNVTTNTVEDFFGILKGGMTGMSGGVA
jgi:hypothetical protein